MWKWDQIICGRIRCPVRVSVDFGFYPKTVSHYFSNLIGPISIGILPMGWLRIRHLLVSFHVSVRRTICMKYWVNHLAPNLRTTKLLPTNLLSANLLSVDLLSKIHWLARHPLIREPGIDLSLLEPCSLMTRLGRLRKDLLPKPSIISIHRHRSCR